MYLENLDRKTTSITFRLSPHLKSDIMERAAENGMSMTDYMEYALSRSEERVRENDETLQQNKRLNAELQAAKTQIATYQQYDVLLQPLLLRSKSEGLYDANSVRVFLETPIALLQYIYSLLKIVD